MNIFFPSSALSFQKLRYFPANRAPFPQPSLFRPRARPFFSATSGHNDDRVQSNTDANRKHNDEIFDILCFFTLATTSFWSKFLIISSETSQGSVFT